MLEQAMCRMQPGAAATTASGADVLLLLGVGAAVVKATRAHSRSTVVCFASTLWQHMDVDWRHLVMKVNVQMNDF